MSVAPRKKPVPVYLRGIPAEIVREAKAQAARRGVTLAGFVADTLARAIYEPAKVVAAKTTTVAEPPDEDLEAEARWYEQNRDQLVRRYDGQFVAIVKQRVIDHDVAFEALAERIFELRGARDTFMPEVRAQKRTMRLRSPRITRRS
jgi:hypothetical protein